MEKNQMEKKKEEKERNSAKTFALQYCIKRTVVGQ